MIKFRKSQQGSNTPTNVAADQSRGFTTLRSKFFTPAILLAVLFAVGAVAMATPDSSDPKSFEVSGAADTSVELAEVNISELPATPSVQMEVNNQTTLNEGDSSSSVKVMVNGEEVPVNQNGTTNTTIPTDNGQVNVNVNVHNGGVAGSVNSHSFSHSHSSSTSAGFTHYWAGQ